MKRLAADLLPLMSGNAARWRAELSLGFAEDAGVTRLIERRHLGPLRVQKPLYPEGGSVCHTVVVHPPGGVAGGDELSIAIRAGDDANALITSPSAAKWYKANGRVSRQQVRIDAGPRAAIEWLPQETILFNAAHVQLDHSVTLAGDASYIGWEILCFGRTASGESFASGRIEQRTQIRRNGKLLWFEQGALEAGSEAMSSPLGLAGRTVCATLIAVGATVPSAVIQAMRNAGGEADAFGVTQLKSVVVARYLGDSSENAKRIMTDAWRQLRPALLGRAAVPPRIWNT